MLVMGPLASAPQAGAERMGLCPVCQATGGETEEEPIKATRTYEGKEYGFCSEKCAKTFDAEPAAYIPPSFPRQAPSFALKDLKGTALSNEKLKGKVVLLDFWATWCAPCKKSMPELQALHAKYADRGFTVLGISIDEGDVAKVKRFVDSKKVTYPVAMDREESPAWEAFNVKAIPAAFLIDQKGRIVAQWTGAPAGTQDVEMELNKLLALD
jgi:peroxiredoxin/YHS domain-containing protein